VSKNGLFLTSFVAAIPGLFLACQMVMAFVNYAGGPTLWTKALAGMLLVIGGLLAVMPVGIFLYAGPKTEKAPKKPKEESAGESAELEAASSEVEIEPEESGEMPSSRAAATDPNLEVVEADSEDFGVTGEMVAGSGEVGEEDFELGPDSEFEMEAADSEDEIGAESEDEIGAQKRQPKKGKEK
jgi:hypothetical protein